MGLVLVIVHSSTAPARTAWSIRFGSNSLPSTVKRIPPPPMPMPMAKVSTRRR